MEHDAASRASSSARPRRRPSAQMRLDPEPGDDADAHHGERGRREGDVECITSGATTPATKPLAALPTKACSDDAMPRRSGTRSSTSSVTTGTIIAQPNE